MTTTQELPRELSKAERDKLARMSEAFGKIERLLFRLGLQGLQRTTKSSAIELQALEQTAHNAGLTHIERQISTLATHVQRYLDKDPIFSIRDYLATLNKLWLLNNMARRRHAQGQTLEEMGDIIGEARRSYTEIAEPLLLQPLGAVGWVSDTDFVGVTIYFHVDGKPGAIYQASNCKPCMYFGRDPQNLLSQSISDYVSFSIHDMAHGAFTFTRAKLSSDGRLSLHKELQVKKAPFVGARAYQAVSVKNWIELVGRLRASEIHPALSSEPSLVFIEPAKFGALTIDDKTAKATAEVFDARGARLLIEVPLKAENNLLVDNLEIFLGKKPKAKPNALFGRAWVSDGWLKFFPFTAIYYNGIKAGRSNKRALSAGTTLNEVHLSLESLKGFE